MTFNCSKLIRPKVVIPAIYGTDEEPRVDWFATTYLDKYRYAVKEGRIEKNIFLEPFWLMEQAFRGWCQIIETILGEEDTALAIECFDENVAVGDELFPVNPFECNESM